MYFPKNEFQLFQQKFEVYDRNPLPPPLPNTRSDTNIRFKIFKYFLCIFRINAFQHECRLLIKDHLISKYLLVCKLLYNKTCKIYLAKLTLALCPPLRETPLSPTIVLSPYINCSKSVFNAHTCITLVTIKLNNKYQTIIFNLQITMVLVTRTKLFHALRYFLQKVVTLVKLLASYTFPAPTGPIIAANRPGLMIKLILSKKLDLLLVGKVMLVTTAKCYIEFYFFFLQILTNYLLNCFVRLSKNGSQVYILIVCNPDIISFIKLTLLSVLSAIFNRILEMSNVITPITDDTPTSCHKK
ncbi:hypothetical protein AGLY_005824 [Aphis glycines]|uniref:Uncharacterized protein n=1 Tax=Aphis glycines TaxID=307491 RepID=A0A6G0TUB1_APHGL|nr:hypothetical protein AGLY_005824 [Aphis glycines]